MECVCILVCYKYNLPSQKFGWPNQVISHENNLNLASSWYQLIILFEETDKLHIFIKRSFFFIFTFLVGYTMYKSCTGIIINNLLLLEESVEEIRT